MFWVASVEDIQSWGRWLGFQELDIASHNNGGKIGCW